MEPRGNVDTASGPERERGAVRGEVAARLPVLVDSAMAPSLAESIWRVNGLDAPPGRAQIPEPAAGVGRERSAGILKLLGAVDERSYPHPVCHRPRRPARRRPTLAAGVRRTAPAGRAAFGPGEAGADPPGHRPGP